MTKQEILAMTGLSEPEFYAQYPTQEAFQMAMGGTVDQYKKGGWIQKATASIKRRGTEGVCTGSKFGGPSCRPGTRRYNLAKTFRKMAKARKKEDGGMVDMYEDGGEMDAYQLMGMPTPRMYGMGGIASIVPNSRVISRQNFPNMGMAYGGMVPAYKKGGFLNTLADIGYGIADVGLGAVGSVTGIKSMQDIIDEDQYSDDKFDNVTNTIGKVGGTALKVIPVTAPFAAAAGAVGNVVNKTAGIDAKNYDPSKHTSSWDKIGNTIEGLGGIASMAMGNIGGAANQVGQLSKAAQTANTITKGANLANAGLNFGNNLNQGQFDLNSLMNIYGGIQGFQQSPTGFAMGGQVNYPEGLQMGDGSYVPMMNRPTTDRLLSNRSANRIPTFAMGGSTGNTIDINVEKGELLIDPKTGKILTEYRGGGMVPHPEEGIDERGTVSAPEGKFIIPKKYAKRYEEADKLGRQSIEQRTIVEKAKKEAKEQQLAMAEEQKAAKAMNRMVAKYGGAIQRMYANGGNVMKYQDASYVVGPRTDQGYFNFDEYSGYGPLIGQTYGPTSFDMSRLFKGIPTSAAQTTPASNPRPYGMSNQTDAASRLNLNNPAFGNVDMSAFTTPTTTFSGSAGFGSTPSSLNLDTSPMTMGQYLTGQSSSYMDPKNIPNTGVGYKGGEYKTPSTGGANYSDLISTGLPYALAASQLVEPMLQKPFNLNARDYQVPIDTKWEDMTGESGRRDMLRAYNLAKYNARQIGGSGALAALQAGNTGYQQALAAYNEALENKNKLGRFEAAKFNKALQQGNLGLAMQIAQFNEQNRAARRNAIRQGVSNLAGTAYNQQANQMTKEALSAAYPDYQFSWNKKRG